MKLRREIDVEEWVSKTYETRRSIFKTEVHQIHRRRLNAETGTDFMSTSNELDEHSISERLSVTAEKNNKLKVRVGNKKFTTSKFYAISGEGKYLFVSNDKVYVTTEQGELAGPFDNGLVVAKKNGDIIVCDNGAIGKITSRFDYIKSDYEVVNSTSGAIKNTKNDTYGVVYGTKILDLGAKEPYTTIYKKESSDRVFALNGGDLYIADYAKEVPPVYLGFPHVENDAIVRGFSAKVGISDADNSDSYVVVGDNELCVINKKNNQVLYRAAHGLDTLADINVLPGDNFFCITDGEKTAIAYNDIKRGVKSIDGTVLKVMNGSIVMRNKDGKCGVKDSRWHTLLPFEYDDVILGKSKMFVGIKKDGKVGVFDTLNRRVIIEPKFNSIEINDNPVVKYEEGGIHADEFSPEKYRNSLFRFYFTDAKDAKGIVNSLGNIVLDPILSPGHFVNLMFRDDPRVKGEHNFSFDTFNIKGDDNGSSIFMNLQSPYLFPQTDEVVIKKDAPVVKVYKDGKVIRPGNIWDIVAAHYHPDFDDMNQKFVPQDIKEKECNALEKIRESKEKFLKFKYKQLNDKNNKRK